MGWIQRAISMYVMLTSTFCKGYPRPVRRVARRCWCLDIVRAPFYPWSRHSNFTLLPLAAATRWKCSDPKTMVRASDRVPPSCQLFNDHTHSISDHPSRVAAKQYTRPATTAASGGKFLFKWAFDRKETYCHVEWERSRTAGNYTH